jgi:O-antigen ligase
MILSLKEFIVVLVIAVVVFRLTKPIALVFIDPADLVRRRLAWFALTATAFLIPSFWAFALVAAPIAIWAGRKDSNPCALYLMLFAVIPPIEIPVPMIGMQYLLMISNSLLLSLCVLAPVAMQVYRSRSGTKESLLHFTDYCLLAYGILTAALYVHAMRPDGGLYPATFTDCLRRGVVFFFDAFVPYFAISRACQDRRKLVDMMATYCLSCSLLAAIGMFEAVRHWYLYGEMAARLGIPGPGTTYLMRGGSLRAMASTGHAMALGHLLVLAYGLWLYLQSRLESKGRRIGGTVMFWGGLFASYTRGAWVGAVLIYFMFAALQRAYLSKLFRAIGGAAVVGTLVYLSPLGDKIVKVMPWFGGTLDTDNIIYRQRLWDRSWQIIKESPFLGDQEAMLKMQELRQGEGIVDVVNTYLGILLNNGFLGLALFLAFILTPALKAWAASRSTMSNDRDLPIMGASIVACIVGMLALFENGSFGGGPANMFYAFAGFATGYSMLVRSIRRAPLTVAAGGASLRSASKSSY